MDKKNFIWVKILVPVLIIAIIGGMWVWKNTSEKPTDGTSELPGVSVPDNLNGADFSLNATEAIDFKALSQYGLPIIVDYGADSCIPCKQMAPVLKTLNAEMQGKTFIKFVDVWKYYEAASNVPIQLIPSQVFYNADGTQYKPSEEITSQISGFKIYDGITIHEGGLTEEQMRAILKEMGVE